MAEALASVLGPALFIPHALYVNGEVIRVFDPIHHVELDRELPAYDRRWTLVQRPLVRVGGELSPRMLELSFDKSLGFYEAPIQLKANGGLLLVDDFGRQKQLSPVDMLSRLMVPLEQKIDHLNIVRAGTSVEVPFTAMLMLSTNMRPEELVDEAFLRRVRYKIYVPDPTEQQYVAIWKALCDAEGVSFDPDVIVRLIDRHYRDKRRALHGVHPRDLFSHMSHIARYREQALELSDELIDLACATYFVDMSRRAT